MTEWVDARGRPVEPSQDIFGVAWAEVGTGEVYGRSVYDGEIPNDPQDVGSVTENIRLHYLDWEIAFEVGHPTGPNRTHGRAAVLPWAKVEVEHQLAYIGMYRDRPPGSEEVVRGEREG